jgi:hypothetical protein
MSLFARLCLSVGVALVCVWCATLRMAHVTRCTAPASASLTNVVLIGDPQMEGLGREERQGLYGWINNVLNDHLLSVALRGVLRAAQPQLVVALGDLFYSQWLNDAEFDYIYRRYVRAVVDNVAAFVAEPVVNMSGNHDIGYGAELRSHTLARFEQHFGPLNSITTVAGHIVAVVNAMALDAIRDGPSLPYHNAAWAFVTDVMAEAADTGMPVILCVHIPLYKPSGSCVGDSEVIYSHDSHGVNSQTVLTEETTELLLARLRPVLVFSGHDHEGCVYRHEAHNVTEYTVRAAQGFYETNLGVLAITRNESSDADVSASFTYAVSNCAFWHTNAYVALVAVTGVWLVAMVVVLAVSRRLSARRRRGSAPRRRTKSPPRQRRTKR